MFSVWYCDINSYNGTASFIAGFDSEAKAIAFVEAQGGYGIGRDWLIKPMVFNPAPVVGFRTMKA